jgi:hypothetical protein
MKNKCYNVILGLSKYAKGIEIFAQAYLANSEANALAMAMQSEFVSSKLLDGYAINSKSVGRQSIQIVSVLLLGTLTAL